LDILTLLNDAMVEGETGEVGGVKMTLTDRFKDLLKRISKNESFKRAFLSILSLIDELRKPAAPLEMTPQQREYVEKVHQLLSYAREITSEFTGKEKLDAFLEHLQILMTVVMEDPLVSEWVSDLYYFVIATLENPENLEDPFNQILFTNWTNRAKNFATFLKLFQKKYFGQTVVEEAMDLLHTMSNHPTIKKLAQDTQKLVRTLPTLRFDAETLKALRSVIVPFISENVGNIALGTIEGFVDPYSFVLENLQLSLKEILPEHIHIKFDCDVDVDLNPESTAALPPLCYLRADMYGMNAVLNDTKFRFRKSSFPVLEDHGVADISIKGITLTFKWIARESSFSLSRVKCRIYSIDVHIKQAHHSWLLPILTHLYSGSVRVRMEKAVSAILTTQAQAFTNKLNETFAEITERVPMVSE